MGILVGIVTHNRKEPLTRLINSLTCQTEKSFHTIIVENGSRVLDLNFIRKSLPQTTLIQTAQASIPHARNVIIDYAKKHRFKAIAYIDDDCMAENTWVEKLYQNFKIRKKYVSSKSNPRTSPLEVKYADGKKAQKINCN